jgi:hypothetical protein
MAVWNGVVGTSRVVPSPRGVFDERRGWGVREGGTLVRVCPEHEREIVVCVCVCVCVLSGFEFTPLAPHTPLPESPSPWR